MPERIDHAAIATNILANVEYKPITPALAVVYANAQVHALLALAEQQRVANLLAFGRALIEDTAKEELSEEQFAAVKVRSDYIGRLVAEGLGL